MMPTPQRKPILSGLNGAIPVYYDAQWKTYTDLSPEQVAAFQTFPQDLAIYASYRRWNWEVCGQGGPDGPQASYITLPGTNPELAGLQLYTDDVSQRKIAGLVQAIDKDLVGPPYNFKGIDGYRTLSATAVKQVYGYVLRWVQATYATEAALLDQINATPPAVTGRAQIDAAFQVAMAAVLAS